MKAFMQVPFWLDDYGDHVSCMMTCLFEIR